MNFIHYTDRKTPTEQRWHWMPRNMEQ